LSSPGHSPGGIALHERKSGTLLSGDIVYDGPLILDAYHSDLRDYDASMLLLKHHIPNEKIQMVMNSPASLVKKKEYAAALNDHKIDVEKWIFLDDATLSD